MQKDDEEFIALKTWLFRHQVLLSSGEEVTECLFFAALWPGVGGMGRIRTRVSVSYI